MLVERLSTNAFPDYIGVRVVFAICLNGKAFRPGSGHEASSFVRDPTRGVVNEPAASADSPSTATGLHWAGRSSAGLHRAGPQALVLNVAATCVRVVNTRPLVDPSSLTEL